MGRRLAYYVAVSADGFIADPSGDFSMFPQDPQTLAALFADYPETCPAHVRDALGVTGAARRFDTVVMGARTHEPALDAGLTSAYPHLRQYVATTRSLPEDPTVTATTDPLATVRALKAEDSDLDVWLCGGGHLAAQLVDEIDELHLKVNPVLLGAGIPLLGGAALPLTLVGSRELPGGVVLSRYARAQAMS
ncbi:deaminase [Marmoricola endophyticus]|uniref:Deaminase n=1 Tax=Marmoricola endophyticus TaxID=2040280 RepID=A0A917F559_9ACTN|nr:dihydrofolate reductase family protein [Marmoricola endophyticus]GGF44485.1 deaminase [Marmoricola endophyticus]